MQQTSPPGADGHTLLLCRSRSRWWLEIELALVVIVAVAGYFSRMTDLSVRGEESRRGLIAQEMLRTGDWIVPRCQGIPLFSRPPLQNWLIAGMALVRGEVDAFRLRFPSDCAIVLTVILVYGYARTFLTRLGALAAASAYISTAQVLELGRMGETDALFALCMSGSLLVWHACKLRGSSPYTTWCLGYLLAALAMLTKGPQAPVYFIGGTAIYLIVSRQWRFAVSKAHLAGIAVYCLVFGAWEIPFALRLGAEGAGQMYVNDVGHRFIDATWILFSRHMLEFPFELVGCLLPWSGLLIVWCNQRFRSTLGQARLHAVFLVLCLLVALPTVWLPPGSKPRYLFCLYPCVALLVGIIADRILRTRNREAWRIVWPVFSKCCALGMVGFALYVLIISVGQVDVFLRQSWWVAGLYALSAGVVAALVWRFADIHSGRVHRAALLTIAGFINLSDVTIVINAFQGSSVDTKGAVAALKEQLPAGTKLVSFGQTHHLFVYHLAEPVAVVDLPRTPGDAAGYEYFCLNSMQAWKEKLPFEWEKIAEINCDKHAVQYVNWRIIVGHRLPAAADGRQAFEPDRSADKASDLR